MISIALGVLIGVIHLLGYWIYYRMSSQHKETNPNTASWSIWAIGSIVNLLTYASMSNDWVKDILPAICSLACIVVYVGYLRQGKFKMPGLTDILIFSLDIVATIVWLVANSPLIGNMACQAGTVLSYIPIIRETMKNPQSERRSPWVLWSMAYVLDVILVIARWNQWGDVVYPATNLILCLIMAIIANRRRTPQEEGASFLILFLC